LGRAEKREKNTQSATIKQGKVNMKVSENNQTHDENEVEERAGDTEGDWHSERERERQRKRELTRMRRRIKAEICFKRWCWAVDDAWDVLFHLTLDPS